MKVMMRRNAAGVLSVYVPNGRTPQDPHFAYKLAWLAALLRTLAAESAASTVVCGDFNVAPTDADVWDPAAFEGCTLPKADWTPSSAAPTGTSSHHEPMKPIAPMRARIGSRAGKRAVLI